VHSAEELIRQKPRLPMSAQQTQCEQTGKGEGGREKGEVSTREHYSAHESRKYMQAPNHA